MKTKKHKHNQINALILEQIQIDTKYDMFHILNIGNTKEEKTLNSFIELQPTFRTQPVVIPHPMSGASSTLSTCT